MKPEVASVVQDHAEAFAARIAETLGTSVDIYVGYILQSCLLLLTSTQDWLHCYALDGISGHLYHPRGLHSLTDPEDHKIMSEMTYSSGLTSMPSLCTSSPIPLTPA